MAREKTDNTFDAGRKRVANEKNDKTRPLAMGEEYENS